MAMLSFCRICLAAAFMMLGNLSYVSNTTHHGVQGRLTHCKQQLTKNIEKLYAQQQNVRQLDGEKQECRDKLDLSMQRNASLVNDLKQLGQQAETLTDEHSRLTEERARLEQELESLRRMRAAAEKRSQQYASLLDRLRSMIDAGTLQVKIRSGRMLVQLSNDVLFPPGSTRLKDEGIEAIKALAPTIASFSDRKFQVIGHSDNTPINTPRYPSNWELSSQRAVEVVRLLIESGVPPQMISAAGQAEFDPITPNDTEDNMAINRRVEVIFVPTIDELPEFDKEEGGTAPEGQTPVMPLTNAAPEQTPRDQDGSAP